MGRPFVVLGIETTAANFALACGNFHHLGLALAAIAACDRVWKLGINRRHAFSSGQSSLQLQHQGNGFVVLTFVLQQPPPEPFFCWQGRAGQIVKNCLTHSGEVILHYGKRRQVDPFSFGQAIRRK